MLYFCVFSSSLEVSLRWNGTTSSQPKLEDVVSKVGPNEAFEFNDSIIENFEDLFRISEIFGCRAGQTIVDFRGSIIKGENANFSLFSSFYNSRITIKNARFVNFSSIIAMKMTSNILFINCSIENSSFKSIPYIFSSKNNIITLTNLSIINCIFEETSVFGFDAATIHFSELFISQSRFISSSLTYSVGQIMDVTKLVLKDTYLENSDLFVMFGACGITYSLDLSNSIINNVTGRNSYLITSDFLSKTNIVNITLRNTKNIMLYKGPSMTLTVEELIITESQFNDYLIESDLMNEHSLSNSLLRNIYSEKGLSKVNIIDSYEASNISLANISSSFAINRVQSKKILIEKVSSNSVVPCTFEINGSTGEIKRSNFSNGRSALYSYSSSLTIKDSNFTKLNETSIIADSTSDIYVKNGCIFNETFALNADGHAEIDDGVIGENAGYSIAGGASIVHHIKASKGNKKLAFLLFTIVIIIALLMVINLSLKGKRKHQIML